MVLDDQMPQMSAQAELFMTSKGGAPRGCASEEVPSAKHEDEHSGTAALLERVAARANLRAALKRVKQNKGSAGVDGMNVDQLDTFFSQHGERLREDLLAGRHHPCGVRRVSIPKKGGGMRELGIPTVVDRVVQQAILQVLQPLFDPTFSPSSYGFRPGRSAHQAVLSAQGYVQEGRWVVVDVDLSKFFDRVNHDVLMGRLSQRIEDKRLLLLIRRFLEAGMMVNGVVLERHEGTPQGGPLSPLLANVLLDDVDKMLERSGHRFVRYADDCNVYVRSERAGERVMGRLRECYGRLHLVVNEEKSAVARVWRRQFLGFSFWQSKGGVVRRRIAQKALRSIEDRVRQMTRRVGGRSLDAVIAELRVYLLGWRGYFRLTETPKVLHELDGWIRRRLRAYLLKQWCRGTTAYRKAIQMGASPTTAAVVARNLTRWWHNALDLAHTFMPNRIFDERGLPRLAA